MACQIEVEKLIGHRFAGDTTRAISVTGRAVDCSRVRVTVLSTPFTADVDVDADGNWIAGWLTHGTINCGDHLKVEAQCLDNPDCTFGPEEFTVECDPAQQQPRDECSRAAEDANQHLERHCAAKQFVVESVRECSTAGKGPVQYPEIQPCFKLHWGDGPEDRIETDDVEILCITACNPYSNVVFRNLTVVVSGVTNADGTIVPTLPDGTPSVEMTPTYLICFGDLLPAGAGEPGELSCVSREAVLISRGAREGDYLVRIFYCYSIELNQNYMDEFKLRLVKS